MGQQGIAGAICRIVESNQAMSASPDSRTPVVARTPREVIDTAISENTKWDWARYLMALLFTVTAIASLVWGVWSNNGWPVAGGAAATGGACFMIRHISAIWKANTALRMIELSLSDKRTANAALDDLRAVYRESLGKGK
ncbi:hypothetical protein [Frigoriglobus tundricola]|nr:hypothetical protein [Frigoriglobus tundricola]